MTRPLGGLGRAASIAILVLLSACAETGTTPAGPTPAPTPTPTPPTTPTPPPTPVPSQPVAVLNLSLNPQTIGSQNQSVGTVTLTGPAPDEGAVVGLASTNQEIARVPPAMKIPAGQTSGTFIVEAATVANTSTTSIVANYGGVANGATLTVTPQSLSAVISGNPFCFLYTGGNLVGFDQGPCIFSGTSSLGVIEEYWWYVKTRNGTHEWRTTSPIDSIKGSTSCSLFAGLPQVSPGRIEVELGLRVVNRNSRSEFTTKTLSVTTQRNCGYPF